MQPRMIDESRPALSRRRLLQVAGAGALAAAFELFACLWYYNRLKKDDKTPTLQCITP